MAERPGAPGPWWSGAVVAAAVLAAYATAFLGTFQFDDFAVIVDEPRVASLGAWWGSMPGIRPLLKLSYALDRQSGLGLAGFHAVNVAVHLAAALLALALLRRLSRLVAPEAAGQAAGDAGPLAGALLFALHPVQTEAVTYVSGRSSALAALFVLASLVAWLEGRARGRPWLVHALSPALMALSLGVKESAVVLPVALVLLSAADVHRPFSWRAAARDGAVHWAVLALGAAAFLASPVYRRMLALAAGLRAPAENLLVQLSAVPWLCGQVLRPGALVADPVLAPASLPAAVAAGLALLGAVAWALRSLRGRWREAALAVLWFLLWLAPASWWLPRPEPANDRQLYLSLLGPAWLVGRWCAADGRLRSARLAVAAAAVLVLGAGTAARNLVYRDEVTFWADVARRAPANARAFNNLGWALARCGRGAEAEAAFRAALGIDAGLVQAGVNLRLLREGGLGVDGEPEVACPR